MNNKITGRIIKGIGGFYYIKPVDPLSLRMIEDAPLIEAKARGKFRHQKNVPMVGDYVEVAVSSIESDSEYRTGVIEKIATRRNSFVRPPVANVDTALITFAAADPKPDYFLVDKLTVLAEYHRTEPVIIVTKCDLIDETQKEKIRLRFDATGYPVFFFKNDSGDDLQRLENYLEDKTVFLAGQSGVGKSTLANRICKNGQMATGQISERSNRGKHTTRHVELLDLRCGGVLLDTPGFSSLSLLWDEELAAEDLCLYFPEFDLGKCKFNTCTHRHEPLCGVKDQVATGEISAKRYEHYVKMYDDLMNHRMKY